jgi:predicted membrane protein
MNPDPVAVFSNPLIGIFVRLGVELAVLLIIIPLIYRRFTGTKENMFAFFLMGIMIFLICVLLQRVEIQLGIALGLFAIFSIIRFRTSNFSTKDMSYLFSIMGLSAINAMFNFPNPIRGTILFNGIIILTILLLELSTRERQTKSTDKGEKKKKKKSDKKAKKEKARNRIQLIYDNLRLLSPDTRKELLKDISNRTGKNVYEVKIRKIDLTAGNAELNAYFRDDKDAGD